MTRNLLGATAGLAALLLAGSTAASAADVPVPPGTTTSSHARLVATASDDAGDLVVVTADQDGTGATHHLDATTRGPAGAWSAPVSLATDPAGRLGDADLALAADGTGVLVWNRYVAPNERVDEVWTRVRHADGTWGPAKRLATRRDVYSLDHALAVPGHVGVAFAGDNYRLHAATATSAGTTWTRTVVPGDEGEDGSTIAIDPQGGLHSVIESIPRGGGGDIWISRLPAGATTWTEQQLIKTPYLSTDEAQLIVDTQGRELLLFGFLGHRGYRPPGDSELVGSTAYRLIRQRTPGGAFTTVWHNPAAGDAILSQADGRVRITYEQWKGHAGRHPRRVQLRTQLLGSSSSVRLAAASQGHFWFAPAGGRQFTVSWIKPKVKELYAAGTSGTPVLLDSRAEERVWGYWARPGRPEVAATASFVAWEHGFVQDGDQDLIDSDVSMAPLP